MLELIINVVTDNILDIVIAVISIVISYYVIPYIKNNLIPYLKDKQIYNTIKKFTKAAEKLSESGAIEKCDKKELVLDLLEKQGIQIDDKISAFIESAVKEIDLVVSTAKNEILKEDE